MAMFKKKISILVPVYNVEHYVAECIESILTQIDERAELILMNDASTDNSGTVLAQYSTHPLINIVHAPYNRGLSGTRNALRKLARGEYIWFIDSDDVMCPGAVSAVMAQIETTPVDVLIGDYFFWDEGKGIKRQEKSFIGRVAGKVFQNRQGSFLKNITQSNKNYVWNKIYRHELIAGLDFVEGVKFEDIYFMTDLAEKCRNYVYCDHVLIAYRVRAGSIVTNINEQYIDDYLGAFIDRLERWRQWYPDHQDKFEDYLAYKIFKRYAGQIIELGKNRQAIMDNRLLICYIYYKYNDVFMRYYYEYAKELNIFRLYAVNKKLKEIRHIMLQLEEVK